MNGVRVWFWLGPGTRLDPHLTVWLYLHAFLGGRYTISHLTAKKHQTSSKPQWRRFDNWYVTFLCIRSPNCCEVLFWGVIFYILHDFSRVHLLKNPWILQQEIIDLEKPNKKWKTTNKKSKKDDWKSLFHITKNIFFVASDNQLVIVFFRATLPVIWLYSRRTVGSNFN